jgi:hypothetical protein
MAIYFPQPPDGGGGGWWPGHPWLLPGPPPASPNAGPIVTASARPASMLAKTLRALIFFTRFPPFRQKFWRPPKGTLAPQAARLSYLPRPASRRGGTPEQPELAGAKWRARPHI